MGTTIDKITFTTDLVLERSITPTAEQLGKHESTMELMEFDNGCLYIEWDIPSLQTTEGIGIEVDEDNPKLVTGYDGVFELPKEAITLLEKNGFNCEEVK